MFAPLALSALVFACMPGFPNAPDENAILLLLGADGFESPYCDPDSEKSVIVYANASANGAGDGSSWTNAFVDLPSALTAATSETEIWIAAGRYLPTNTGNPSETLRLNDGIGLHGGFAGTETLCSQRDSSENSVIITGDIDGDDVVDADGVTQSSADIAGTNSNRLMEINGASVQISELILTGGDQPDNIAALQIIGASNASIQNVAFLGNRSDGTGGAVAVNADSSAVFRGCVFSGNESVSENGGALVMNGIAVIDECVFRNNHANFFGGAIALFAAPDLTLRNVVFENNAASRGGALRMSGSGGALEISNGFFSANVSTNGGGAVSLGPGHSAAIASTVFQNNTGRQGGALELQSAMAISNTTFQSNTATGTAAGNGGGAIFASNGSIVNVSDSTFILNSAASRGGAVFIQSGAAVSLGNGFLLANSAPILGGAVYNSGSFEVLRSILIANDGGAGGGAICTEDASANSVTAANVFFHANFASGGGGLQAGANASVNLVNVTFEGNAAIAGVGGAILLNDVSSQLTLGNSIVWNNSSTGAAEVQNYSNSSGATAAIVYTLFEDCSNSLIPDCATGATGNLETNPQFLAAPDIEGADNLFRTADDGYSLSTSSPAVGAGDDAFCAGSCAESDITGATRFNGSIDMGAYERQ